MKKDIKIIFAIATLFSPIILLMLIDDGLFGETIKEITSYIIFVLCIILFILIMITNFWYKAKQKKEGKK